MRKLIFVVPVQINEAGGLNIKAVQALQLLVGYLKHAYEITLMIQSYREKTIPDLFHWGVTLIYDNSHQDHKADASHAISRFQSSYYMWRSRTVNNEIKEELSDYDSLIAWNGCSPWCLATALKQVNARKRFLWIHESPELYLMKADHAYYSEICSDFDKIIASDEKIKVSLDSVFKGNTLIRNCIVLRLPIDVSWYWEQSEHPVDYEFQKDKINLLAVSRMCQKSSFEQLPRWLSEHREQYPFLRCYLIGDGERIDRYIQQIAIYSVDTMIVLVGKTDNLYSYIRSCDAVLICKDERFSDVETAAEVWEIPVIHFDELEKCLPGLKKKERLHQSSDVIWKDEEKFMKILDGK